MRCLGILIQPLISFIFVSHDVVILRAERKELLYNQMLCPTIVDIWVDAWQQFTPKGCKKKNQQIPALVFPSQHILIKALLFVLYREIKYNYLSVE